MSNNDIEIEPCPFCGDGGFSAQSLSGPYWFVLCSACEAEGPPAKDSEEAIEAWNKRCK